MVAEPRAGARGQSQARMRLTTACRTSSSLIGRRWHLLAIDGNRVDCPASANDTAGGGTQDYPVFAAKRAGGAAGPGVEYR
jgi:hypothetical protein